MDNKNGAVTILLSISNYLLSITKLSIITVFASSYYFYNPEK